MNLTAILDLVAADMAGVNTHIRENMRSEVGLIEQMGEYIIAAGGKRLRPVVAILAAKACGYTEDRHQVAASIIEIIHTATLLHDDVVDASDLRRGQETANSIWGNESAVLVGDFLFSRAFEMAIAMNDVRVMQILASTINRITEGEVMQLLYCNEPDTTKQQYMTVIECKTAKLFEAAAEIGAVLAQQDSQMEASLAAYGTHLGTAFQVADDLLDYRADSETLGKNVGDDLAEGKPTLPIIYAMQHGSATQVALLRQVIENGDREKLAQVVEIIEDTKALDYTQTVMLKESEKAMATLVAVPDSEYKAALLGLIEFSVARLY
ncbi:polyprenyl synthetase family protein [Gammaproteobacteria bacterium]|nr:polyprenyl synthetase family protein [Gammaproteobacteria bacterium]